MEHLLGRSRHLDWERRDLRVWETMAFTKDLAGYSFEAEERSVSHAELMALYKRKWEKIKKEDG